MSKLLLVEDDQSIVSTFNYQTEMVFLFVLQLKKEELCQLFS